jgi:hypothetical protein
MPSVDNLAFTRDKLRTSKAAAEYALRDLEAGDTASVKQLLQVVVVDCGLGETSVEAVDRSIRDLLGR